MNSTNALGESPMAPLIIKLAIPSMIAQFVNVLYSIIDRMYIGNIPEVGNLALAGVGICAPIVTLLTSFGTLVGIGGSILMAMRLGEKDIKKAEQIVSNSFLMLILFSALLTVTFLLLKNKLLFWFGASPVTFPYANTYMTIYTIGTFFALMAIGLNYFITGQGLATLGMTTVLIGALANIILDPVFIFLLDMGVAGAAVATVLAQMLSCTFALFILLSKKVTIRITFGGCRRDVVEKILSLGLSPFLILASDSIIIIIMNAMLQKYGGASQGDLLISCATIVQSYLLIITGPMLGITGGTQSVIAYNYGARNSARVKRAEKCVLLLCFAFTTVMFIISRVLPQYFVSIFTRVPENVALSVWGIQVTTLAIIPLSFQYTLVDGLTALGRTKTALCLSAFRKTQYVLFTVLLPLFLSAKSIFYAEPLTDLISSVLTTIVFLSIFQKHLDKREECLPEQS